jgi:hypothetical protein
MQPLPTTTCGVTVPLVVVCWLHAGGEHKAVPAIPNALHFVWRGSDVFPLAASISHDNLQQHFHTVVTSEYTTPRTWQGMH